MNVLKRHGSVDSNDSSNRTDSKRHSSWKDFSWSRITGY